MSFFIIIIGYFSAKLNAARLRYKTNLYRKSIKSDTGNYSIGGDVNIAFPKNVFIGDKTYINGGNIVASPNAKIIIGQNCLISYNVHIRTDMHNYIERTLINKQGVTEKDIIVGNDVWIGYGVQIMSGVTIADGCVIAAGAIVTKNTDPYSVYAGIPARKIKMRG